MIGHQINCIDDVQAETSENVLLKADSLTCTYHSAGLWGERPSKMVLKSVSLSLYRGEVLGIVGHNGAGKSTLLRVLAGVQAYNGGNLLCYCRPALLTLRSGFLPYLSGRENALLSGIAQGMRRKEMIRQLDAVREFADLGNEFETSVREYSSGMVARLSFAVALQVQADVLLVDEVLSVGDVNFRERSLKAMKERIASGSAAIVVSHNPSLLQQICTHVTCLAGGSLSCPVPVTQGESFRKWLTEQGRSM